MPEVKVIKKAEIKVEETVDTVVFDAFDFSLVMTDEEIIRKKRLFLNGAGVLRKAAMALDEMIAKRDKSLTTNLKLQP